MTSRHRFDGIDLLGDPHRADKSKKPVYDGSGLKVDYVKVDGEWLINYITTI